MGVKRTIVATQVTRVIEDDRLPNAVQTGTLKAILDADVDESMMDHVEQELVSSLGMRAERLYEWAEKGNYPFGLPSGKFVTGNDGAEVLTAVLQAIEGAPVLLDYAQFGVANDLHIGWMHLMSDQGYDPATNQLGVLTAAKGTPVYLDDMIVVIPTAQANNMEAESLEQWGIAARAGYTPERTTGTTATRQLMYPSPIQVDASSSVEHLLVKTIWKTSTGLQRGSFTIPITGYDSSQNYWHARYLVGGVVRYWMYKDGLGTYPTLDAVHATAHDATGSFFPFMYFRFNKTSEISDKTTDSYKASKAYASRLAMPYDVIATAIDGNQDIDQIEQAMVMMMVPANTDNELEQQYLFSFFDNLYLSDAYNGHRYTSADQAELKNRFGKLAKVTTPSLVIEDKRFKISLEFDAIYKRRVAGTIGKIGASGGGFQTSNTTQTVVDIVTGAQTVITTTSSYHYYRRQVSTGFYDEIQVPNLKTVWWILGAFKYDVGDNEKNILMIPIDRAITGQYSVPVREKLYSRALYYVFNSAVVEHLKWYQTEAFSAVLIIVAIVITVYSWGTAASEAWALVGAGLYGAAALVILEMVLEYVVVYLAMKLFVRLFGVRAAFVIAIVAAAVGMGAALGSEGVAGAPWAGELLQLSSGLTSAIGKKLQSDTKDLLGEQESILKDEAEATKLLQTGKDLLGGNIHLNPFVIFGEAPQDYYNRTVHSGNIGVVGIDAVASYVDIALMLPKLNNSVGGIGYDY